MFGIGAIQKLAEEMTTELKANSEGYPPDLETLVEGVSVAGDAFVARFDVSGEPVYITYLTAEAGPNGPKFRADPYNRDPALLARYFGEGGQQVAAFNP